MPVTEGGADEDLADEITASSGEAASVGGSATVVGVGGVPAPPGGRQTPE